MARFKLEIFKRIGTEQWLNRYWIETVSFTSAVPTAEQVIIAEANIHSDQVAFVAARISTQVEGDNLFQNLPLSIFGNVPGSTTGALLPLWNVVKCLFTKDLARPDYKYYRGILGEANSDSGSLAAGVMTAVDTAMSAVALSDPQLIFPFSGPGYTNVTVDPLIRMRQLHRSRRRVTSGGLVTPS